VFLSSKYVSPLHWLKPPGGIHYKPAVLSFKCLHGTMPPYLTDEFLQSSYLEAQGRLCSLFSLSLIVHLTWLSRRPPVKMPPADWICKHFGHVPEGQWNVCLLRHLDNVTYRAYRWFLPTVVYNIYTLQIKLLLIGWRYTAHRSIWNFTLTLLGCQVSST